MATEKEILPIDGREVTVSNPRKVYFPETGPHEARPRELLPGGRRGCPARRRRPADGAQAVRGRRGRPAVLPEAGARERARVHPDRDPDVPVGADRGRDRHRRRRGARLGRQPRLHRPQPAPGPRRGPRPSRRAARRPRPGAGRGVAADPRGGARRARVARGGRARRLAEDLGLARHPHQCPDRAALDVPGGAPGGPRPRPRRGAPRPGPRHLEMVEGGAPRRLPRLQPERQGPDGRVRLLRPAAARCTRLHAADLGRGARPSRPRRSRSTPSRPATRRSATRAPGSTRPSAPSRRSSS